jgi:hypothetical protein
MSHPDIITSVAEFGEIPQPNHYLKASRERYGGCGVELALQPGWPNPERSETRFTIKMDKDAARRLAWVILSLTE